MKMKFIFCLLIGLIATCCADSDTKEKRQIYQTRVVPHHQQIPDNEQLETIYGTHPNQFVIRTNGQGQPLQHYQQQQPQQQHQQPQQHNTQPEQPQEVIQQHYAFIPQIPQQQQVKSNGHAKPSPKKAHIVKPTQYIHQEVQPQFVPAYPDQHYQQLLSEEQILRLLQEEIGRRPSNAEERQIHHLQQPQQHIHHHQQQQQQQALHQQQQQQQQQQHIQQQPKLQPKPIPQSSNQKLGLGNYREAPGAEHSPIYNYVPQHVQQQPVQFYNQAVIDYHRAVPSHPLAVSSLEKELEKLVASNKPTLRQNTQPQTFKPNFVKPQQKQYTPPVPEQKGFSFFPDFAQLSGFNAPGPAYFEQPVQIQKNSPINGQYLEEVASKQKVKLTHTPFQPKQQFYPTQQKSESQYSTANSEARNSAMKIVEAPTLQYEKANSGPSAPANIYYKPQHGEHLEQQAGAEPSRSAIFVSQGTGIHPPQASQNVKPYSGEKMIKLPPQDGKPITQEEFQALVDAGYAVTAVPVPVPVPYESYIREQQEYKLQGEPENQLRRSKDGRHGITYLHPIGLQQEQDKHSQKASS